MREEVRTEVTSLLMATFESTKKLPLKCPRRSKKMSRIHFYRYEVPSYEEVRYQLGRARRAGVLNVEDPSNYRMPTKSKM
uniref:Uncharacterized protein n=1 Tax=Ditylenchus dipsaci TaxID=166011 RepID=A0A915E6V0_9BILA